MYKSYFQNGGDLMQPNQMDAQNQVAQIVQQFAQIQGIDPQQVMQQLQQLAPEQQDQAIQQMVQIIQQAMNSQNQGMNQAPPDQMQSQQPMMQYGGLTVEDIYMKGVIDAINKNKKNFLKKKKEGGVAIPKETITLKEAFTKARLMNKKSFKYEGLEYPTKFSFE